MTATVTENAVLGLLPLEAIEQLLRDHPHVWRELLSILGESGSRDSAPHELFPG